MFRFFNYVVTLCIFNKYVYPIIIVLTRFKIRLTVFRVNDSKALP